MSRVSLENYQYYNCGDRNKPGARLNEMELPGSVMASGREQMYQVQFLL